MSNKVIDDTNRESLGIFVSNIEEIMSKYGSDYDSIAIMYGSEGSPRGCSLMAIEGGEIGSGFAIALSSFNLLRSSGIVSDTGYHSLIANMFMASMTNAKATKDSKLLFEISNQLVSVETPSEEFVYGFLSGLDDFKFAHPFFKVALSEDLDEEKLEWGMALMLKEVIDIVETWEGESE